MSAEHSKTSLKILAAGAGLGVVLIAFNLFALNPSSRSALSPGIAAMVNGRPISMEDYGRVIASFEADRREPTTAADRARLLDRLIEEELLVQRGIEVDLPTYDKTVRSTLVQSMITSATAENKALQPSEEDLRGYYRENRELFAASPQLHIRAYRPTTLEEASQARADPSKRPPPDQSLPDGLIPSHKVREYLGPTALQHALALRPGEISEPIELSSGTLLIELIDKQQGGVPPYDDIRTQVAAAYAVARDEQTLRDTLSWLKKTATISRVSTE